MLDEEADVIESLRQLKQKFKEISLENDKIDDHNVKAIAQSLVEKYSQDMSRINYLRDENDQLLKILAQTEDKISNVESLMKPKILKPPETVVTKPSRLANPSPQAKPKALRRQINLPFIAGKSVNKSHSVSANIQQIMHSLNSRIDDKKQCGGNKSKGPPKNSWKENKTLLYQINKLRNVHRN